MKAPRLPENLAIPTTPAGSEELRLVTDEEITRQLVSQEIPRIAPVIAGGSVLMVVAVAVALYWGHGEAHALTAAALASGSVGLWIWFTQTLGRLSVGWSHALAAALGSVWILGCILLPSPAPYPALVLGLVMVGSCSLFLTGWWHCLMISSAWGAWLYTIWRQGTGFPKIEEAALMFGAACLGWAIHRLRRIAWLRLTEMEGRQESIQSRCIEAIRRARESQECLRIVSNLASVGFVLHSKGRILWANETMGAMVGRDPGELAGWALSELLDQTSSPGLREVLQFGSCSAIEVNAIGKSGARIPCELTSCSVLPEEGGSRLAVFASLQTRARLKELEHLELQRRQALQERKATLAELERAMDEPGRTEEVLRRIHRIGATLPGQSLGSCLLLRVESEATFRVVDSTVAGLESDVQIPAESPLGKAVQWSVDHVQPLEVDCREGDPFEIRESLPGVEFAGYRVAPVRADGQGIGAVCCFHPELSSRSGEEMKLLEILAGRLGTAIGRGALFERLRALEETLATTRAEYERLQEDAALSADRLEFSQQALREAVEQMENLRQELRNAENRLARANAEAGRASRVKSEFLQMMSHELRTPLNGILGMANLLLYTKLDQKQQDYVDTLCQSAQSLLGSIDDILDFTQLQTGQCRIERARFDLHGLLRELAGSVAPLARQKNLGFFCSVLPGLPPTVEGDGHRVGQVLRKLLDNAVKFTDEGEVSLSVETVERGSGYAVVHFSVRDTGIGIAESVQETIFQPFTQGNSSSTRRHGGTGMGLPLCNKLVQLMGGELSLKSSLLAGSTFDLRLRFDVPGLEPEEEEPMPGMDGTVGGRALIVDRSESFRHALARHLRSLGLRADATDVPSDSLKMLVQAGGEGDPYSVMFVDAEIQQPNARTICRLVRSGPLTSGTRIILVAQGKEDGLPSSQAEACWGAQRLQPREFLGCNLIENLRALLAPPTEANDPARHAGLSSAARREGESAAIRPAGILVGDSLPEKDAAEAQESDTSRR